MERDTIAVAEKSSTEYRRKDMSWRDGGADERVPSSAPAARMCSSLLDHM